MQRPPGRVTGDDKDTEDRDALRQATLPPGIELREIPPELELGSYRYALVGDVIVIVDPDSGYIIKAFQ